MNERYVHHQKFWECERLSWGGGWGGERCAHACVCGGAKLHNLP